MNEKKFLSVAVVDTETQSKKQHPFRGMVNMWDIVTAVCFNELFEEYDDEKIDANQLNDDIFDEAMKMDVFKLPVKNVLGISEESKTLWVYDSTASLSQLMEAFTSGLHRALVRTKANSLSPQDYLIVSQTDVIRFLLSTNSAAAAKLLEQPLSATSAVTPRVISIGTDSSALTGFRKLTMYDVQGVAVVNKSGDVVASLSASDLRGLNQKSFKTALLPVTEFLKLAHAQPQNMVTCTRGEKVGSVMKKLLDAKVHRAWVLDDDKSPFGTVSMTDIIAVFSPHDNRQEQ